MSQPKTLVLLNEGGMRNNAPAAGSSIGSSRLAHTGDGVSACLLSLWKFYPTIIRTDFHKNENKDAYRAETLFE